MAHPTYTLLFVSKKENFQEGIKGLILRHCGKQNFIYHGKLRLPQHTRCRSTRDIIPHVLRLMYCGSCAAVTYLQIHSCRSTRRIKKNFMCTAAPRGAAVSLDGLQYKPFYTVPKFSSVVKTTEFALFCMN